MGHKPTFRTLVGSRSSMVLCDLRGIQFGQNNRFDERVDGARLAHQPLLQTVFEPITDLPVLEQHLPSGD